MSNKNCTEKKTHRRRNRIHSSAGVLCSGGGDSIDRTGTQARSAPSPPLFAIRVRVGSLVLRNPATARDLQ